ncbi:hypothetical protein J2T17_006340 [Paenibacillus mucilaginosus]|uniref:hypothetical protein n=1 Tax=Paenibacillus mucilaginosus TaxID=61624 RepID=UPI003D25E67C
MAAEPWCFKEYRFIPELTYFIFETEGVKDPVLYSAHAHYAINEVLEKNGIEGWHLLIPYFRDYNYDCLERGEKEYIEKSLEGQPGKGLEFIRKNQVLEVVQAELPNHYEAIRFLMDLWNDGYFLYLDY